MGLLNVMRRINEIEKRLLDVDDTTTKITEIETRLSDVENNTLKKVETYNISASDSALSIELDKSKTYLVEVINSVIPDKSLFTLQYTSDPNWKDTVIGGRELSLDGISVTINSNGITVSPFTDVTSNIKKVTIYEFN